MNDKATVRAIDLRRRLLVNLGIALFAGAGRLAYATPAPAPTLPQTVVDLDAATLAFFEAARAGRWDDAHKQLEAVRNAARSVPELQSSFTDAGGELSRFFAATNALTADLVDASAAESVWDRTWLVSAAENLLARAGDLTEPYASRIDATAPRLEVLLVLARRMRRAPAWLDTTGYASARRSFDHLWPALRGELRAKRPHLVESVDAARAGITGPPSSANAHTLYVAVRNLLGAVAVG